jgi:signal transduction histidine kinase
MQQTDRSQDRRQGSKAPTPPAQLGTQTVSAPGRVSWLEKIAGNVPIAEAQRRMQPANTGSQRPEIVNSAQSLAGLIHDARNMVAAMDLYCDLLEEPGVLSAPFRRYAGELRLVSGAGRRLLEKLAIAESMAELEISHLGSMAASTGETVHPSGKDLGGVANLMPENLIGAVRRKVFPDAQPVANLARELRASQNLLSALAGPGIVVGLSLSGGARPIAMTGDDLTRVLVNLTRNAAEAMPGGGHLQIALEESSDSLSLCFTDNGPGIPDAALEAIFAAGYSTRIRTWPAQQRGLGLSIVRSIVAAAGGSVWAANRRADSARLPSNPGSSDPVLRPESATGVTSALDGAVLGIEFPILAPPIET